MLGLLLLLLWLLLLCQISYQHTAVCACLPCLAFVVVGGRPFKEENVVVATRGSTLSQYYQTAATSESILVIGGGIVGVEVAAELAETFPGKSISLVHSVRALGCFHRW